MGKREFVLGLVLVLLLMLAGCSGANSEDVLTGDEPEPWDPNQPGSGGVEIGNPYEYSGSLMDGGYRVLPPRTVAPPADAVFYEIPRTVTLEWIAISVVGEYEIEVDACDSSVVHPAVDCGTWTEEVRATTSSPTYTFEFSGAGSGRWRVRAVAGDAATRFSEYLYFEFVR